MPTPQLAPVPPTLRVGIVSKPAHAKGLVAALRKAGVEPVMLGGSATSIPVTMDVILYRTASAAHTSQPTLASWSKQEGHTLIQGNGSSRLIEELRTRGFLTERAKVPTTFPLSPAPALVPGVEVTDNPARVPGPGTIGARCYDALADGPLLPGEIALRLGIRMNAVRFAVAKDARLVNRYPASLGRRYGLLDRADRDFHGSPTLEETQERGRIATTALKALKGKPVEEEEPVRLGIECAVCAGMGPHPDRDDSLRCEKHEGHRRCGDLGHVNKTDAKPCSRWIGAVDGACWHHRVKPEPDEQVPLAGPEERACRCGHARTDHRVRANRVPGQWITRCVNTNGDLPDGACSCTAWHPNPKPAPAPAPVPAPVLADDDPTSTVRDEIEFVVLWMREWNVSGLTLLSNGTVRLSDTPRKTEPVAVRFVVEGGDK